MKIADIKVDRSKRQRQSTGFEPNLITELASSLATVGLINPIVVNEKGELIAGERRLVAAKQLGWDEIDVRQFNDLPREQQYLIEIEENVKRAELAWKDHVEAVRTYHQMKVDLDPNWELVNTANALGFSPLKVARDLKLGEHLEQEEKEGGSAIANSSNYTTARQKVEKKEARRKEAILDGIELDSKKPRKINYSLLNTDFVKWAKNYKGKEKFNFVHCDFPYGIDAQQKGSLNEKGGHEQYDDSPEIFEQLMLGFSKYKDNFLSENCHIMFWQATNKLESTRQMLHTMGFKTLKNPLIWFKTSGGGICPDPRFHPKHVYETALIAYRGERMLAQGAISDCVAAANINELHKNEKPKEMLTHYFRMFIDGQTRMLDPTMGCGNSIWCARKTGALFSLGIELNQSIYKTAESNIKNEDTLDDHLVDF